LSDLPNSFRDYVRLVSELKIKVSWDYAKLVKSKWAMWGRNHVSLAYWVTPFYSSGPKKRKRRRNKKRGEPCPFSQA